jgi:hypothetical protein
MRFGMYLRELSRSRLGLLIAGAVALLAASRVLFSISVLPPGLESRSIDVATASTHVLIDTPRSTLTDLRQDFYEIRSLSQRAVILGNVMASPPVRDFIGKRVGIPADSISVTAPVTPDQPQVVKSAEDAPHTSDILKRPTEYRLSIQANPTVPVLDIYAEAPNENAAKGLAVGAINGLRDYLDLVADQRGTPGDEQVDLQQLGQVRGGVINSGAGITMAIIVFALVYALCSAAVLWIARVRRGWAAAEGLGGRPARGLP